MDANVFVSALISSEGASREVLRRCLLGQHTPLIGEKLFQEFEDVRSRPEVLKRCILSAKEINDLLDAFLARSHWTDIFYLWRPNLRDEGDNHLVELAVAGGAQTIVTHNVKDFRASELKFDFETLTPGEFLRRAK